MNLTGNNYLLNTIIVYQVQVENAFFFNAFYQFSIHWQT